MTRVLAYTSPMSGHLFPVVPILDELHGHGHRVAVRTLAVHVPGLRLLGLDADALSPPIEGIELGDWQARSPSGAQRRAMHAFGRRARFDAEDLRTAMDEVKPDLLLVDIMAFGALATAEASGLPWAAWLPYPAWLRGPGVPPYGPGLAPGTGTLGHIRDRVLGVAGALGPGRNLTAAVNQGRRAAGISPLRGSDSVLLRPPLVLSMTAEPFEYPRPSWPDSFRLIGPCTWEPPAPPPDWLATEDRPIVLVATSTDFQADGRLVTTTFEALSDRQDLLVVATVPCQQTVPITCPPNGRIERFVAHGALLERAAAVICHGGMGTTQKALAAGVPVCAVPFGRDQFEVARRVEVSRSGACLPARRLRADRLRTALELTIDRADGARRMARIFGDAGGAPAAARAIESLAAGWEST